MKISEAGFWGSFWDTLSGKAADASKRLPAGGGAEAQAKENFKAKLTQRATSALLSTWNNGGIDLNLKGLSSYKDPIQEPLKAQSRKAKYQQIKNLRQQQQPSQGQLPLGQGPAVPTAPSAPTAPKAQAKTALTTPFTFGGEKYTKTRTGWVNSKNKPADANTAKILNRAAQQAQQSPQKPRMRVNPQTKQWEPISEQELLNDSKYSSWNTMLASILNEQSTTGGQSPSDFMYPIIKQMLQGFNFEKRPDLVQVIKSALEKWEAAFKAQVIQSSGKFDGKFNKATQAAFDNVVQVVADQAFASLGVKGPNKPAGKGQTPNQAPASNA